MKPTLLSLFLAAAAAIPSGARADYACEVRVAQLLVYSSGLVNVLHTGRGDFTAICNLEKVHNGVAPTTCAMWVALLEKIKSKGGRAAFWFGGDGACETLPTYWNSPSPIYIGDATP